MENMKEALQYLVNLGGDLEKPDILEICGKTYATRRLERYGKREKADPIKARNLSALIDYIISNHSEFPSDMIIYVEGPTNVRLISTLDAERDRECLFECRAETSEFHFDNWYDQERFVIELQANFIANDDLAAILSVSGNVEAKTTANYGDDGTTQKTTIKSGIATREDVIVPNPATLIPYRTFQEVEQPASTFVFRIRDSHGEPEFKLIEAEGGIWRLLAVANIKNYLAERLSDALPALDKQITIIG